MAILLVTTTLLLSTGTAALIAYTTLVPTVEDDAMARVAEIGASKATQLELQAQNHEELLYLTASRTQMRKSLDLANDGANETERLTAILQDAVDSISAFAGAELYGRNGELVAQAGRGSQPATEFSLTAPGDPVLFSFHGDGDFLWNHMFVSLFLEDKWVGSLVMVVDGKTFSDLLAPENEELGVVRHFLILPAHPDSYGVGTVRWGYISDFQKNLNAGPQLQRVVEGFRGQTDDAHDFEGRVVFADARDVAVGNGALMTNLDRETALAPLAVLRNAGFAALGIALISGLGAGFVLAGIVARPVSLLRESVMEMHPGGSYAPPEWPRATANEMREFGDKFAETALQMEQALDARSRLINQVSHELNTPMTPATLEIGVLRTGLHGELSEGQLQSLATIESQIQKISGITKELQGISRLEGEEIGSCDISEAIHSATAAYARQAEQNGNELAVSVPSVKVRGGAARLGQMFEALLDNAIKFSDGGMIHVSCHQEGGRLQVRVRDKGRGIPEEHWEHVFDPFARLDDHAEGTGFGLYTARRIAEHAGGAIWIEGGEGTTVVVELPLDFPNVR